MRNSKTITSSPAPAIGVGAIVFNEQNEVLLIKRDKPPAHGFWSVPGGKLEPGESMVAGCQREIKEETGLDIEIKQIVAIVERRVEGFHYVIIDFLAQLLDANASIPVPQSDAADACWVGIEAITAYPLVEGLAEIIKRSYQVHCTEIAGGLYKIDSKSEDFILSVF